MEEKRAISLSGKELYDNAFYAGYVIGVCDTFSDIAKGVNVGQICDIVGKFLEDHQEERHKEGRRLVMTAIIKAFWKK